VVEKQGEKRMTEWGKGKKDSERERGRGSTKTEENIT